MKTDCNDVLSALTKVGKRISICAEITDSEQATKLLGTMYKVKEGSNHGMTVYSWGNFDEVEAQGNKLQAIEKECNRHRVALDTIMCSPLSSFLIKE